MLDFSKGLLTDFRQSILVRHSIAIVVLTAVLAVTAFAQQTEAEKLIEAGHWKKARALVEDRLRQAPTDPLSHYLLSQIRHAFGDDAAPGPLAEKAVALDGRVAKYHRQFAETLGIQAQHAGPIQLVFLSRQFRRELDTAMSLDPHDIQAQRDLLEYYLVAPGIAGGDMQKAAVTAERIAALDAAEGFLARARVAQARKQDAQTENFLRQAAGIQPPSYRAHVELARFYMAKDHPDPLAAESVAKEMLKLDPTRVEPYALLAEIYAELGDWNALDAILSEASQQLPDDRVPYYRAADRLLTRDPARAERYLRIYLGQEPEGNEPPLADARRKLDSALQARGRRTVANVRQSTDQ
jgi:tetratricopeptide (TPR) repeat protein